MLKAVCWSNEKIDPGECVKAKSKITTRAILMMQILNNPISIHFAFSFQLPAFANTKASQKDMMPHARQLLFRLTLPPFRIIKPCTPKRLVEYPKTDKTSSLPESKTLRIPFI